MVAVVLSACGDDGGGGTQLDAAPADSPAADASSNGCDYTESGEATNGLASTTTDDIGSVTTRKVICGVIKAGGTNDIDDFKMSIPTNAYVRVRVFLSDPSAVANAYGLVVEEFSGQYAGVAGANMRGGHIGFVAHPNFAGTRLLEVAAFSAQSSTIAAPVPYKVVIEPVTAAMLCPTVMAAATYVEAADGTTHTENDVFSRDSSRHRLTFSTTDMPEPTGITLDTTPARISGISANVTGTGIYLDRDTYAFSAGPAINEVVVRIDWTANRGMSGDLFVENPPPDGAQQVVMPLQYSQGPSRGPQIMVVPVDSDAYWLFIGGSGPIDADTTYDISLCGAMVTAP